MSKIRPDILTRFSTDREEPLKEQISIRVSASLKKKVKNTKNWQEKLRKAMVQIAEEAEAEEAEAEKKKLQSA